MAKLNIGCGFDKRDGYINADISPEAKPDVVFDMNKFPYPWKDDTFDYVLARDVLEHIPKHNLVKMIEELHRISKPNAIWDIRVPFYNCRLVQVSVVHFGGFDFGSFNVFTHNPNAEGHYSNRKLKVLEEKAEVTARGRFIPFRKFLRHSIGELYNIINFKIQVVK